MEMCPANLESLKALFKNSICPFSVELIQDYYFFTCDEVDKEKGNIYLIEGRHSMKNMLPSLEDIKNGLLKMSLFTNLKEVKIGAPEYTPVSILKLTADLSFSINRLRKS